MNVLELKEAINSSSEKNIYVILSTFDVSNGNRFVISAIEDGTLIRYKDNWEFEDEIKYNLSEIFNSEEEIESELKKLRKKGVIRGTFLILSPDIED